MNIAVILSNKNLQITCDCIKVFQQSNLIDAIVAVAPEEEQDALEELLEQADISKYADFAPSADTRQLSVYAGLATAREVVDWYEVPAEIGGYIQVGVRDEIEDPQDLVVIYPAGKACADSDQIARGIECATEAEGAFIRLSPKNVLEVYELDRLLAIYDGMLGTEWNNAADSVQIAVSHGMDVREC